MVAVEGFSVKRNPDAYSLSTRWVGEAWYQPPGNTPEYHVGPQQCVTSGWTKGQARRRLQNLVVRVANEYGGIV